MKFGCRLIGDMSHVRLFLSTRLEQPFAATVHLLDRYSIAWKERFDWFIVHSSDN